MAITYLLSCCNNNQVEAIDNDLGHGGLIEYSVSDSEHFSIDSGGIIYNTKPLDYEGTGGQYDFYVIAKNPSK